jgi:hypothetical protein
MLPQVHMSGCSKTILQRTAGTLHFHRAAHSCYVCKLEGCSLICRSQLMSDAWPVGAVCPEPSQPAASSPSAAAGGRGAPYVPTTAPGARLPHAPLGGCALSPRQATDDTWPRVQCFAACDARTPGLCVLHVVHKPALRRRGCVSHSQVIPCRPWTWWISAAAAAHCCCCSWASRRMPSRGWQQHRRWSRCRCGCAKSSQLQPFSRVCGAQSAGQVLQLSTMRLVFGSDCGR